MMLAAMQGREMVNLSIAGPTRLVFPRIRRDCLQAVRVPAFDSGAAAEALAQEAELAYHVPSGRYWDKVARFDPAALRALDAVWLRAASGVPQRLTA